MARLTPPTPGTRMMLWVYPLVTLLYGFIYSFQSPDRMMSGSFEQAKAIASMRTWGLIFLTVAALKIACILVGGQRWHHHRDDAYIFMMCLGGALYSTWGFLFLISAADSPTASFAGCLLPFGWAVAHLAMLATVVKGRSGA